MRELYSNLNENRLQEKFCDVFVKVENRTFGCHRIILVSAMKYFETGKFNEGKKEEIELEGISADGFEGLLNYIYTDEITQCG